MHFECPFGNADIDRAATAEVTPRMFANAAIDGVRAALVFRESYLKPLLQGLLKQSARDRALIDLHYRMVPYMAAICRLAKPIYFQSIAASARSRYEVGLDIALLSSDDTPDPVDRLAAFTRVERYRVAKRIVDFYASRSVPSDLDLAAQRALCEDVQESAQVEALVVQNWGRKKNGDLNWPKHWSRNADTRARARQAGGPWEARYVRYYSMFSWHVHGGMVGADGLPRESFDLFAAEAYRLATDVVLDTYSVLGIELLLARAMPDWTERLTFLSRVIGLALVDERLQSLGEPVRFRYLEEHELSCCSAKP